MAGSKLSAASDLRVGFICLSGPRASATSSAFPGYRLWLAASVHTPAAGPPMSHLTLAPPHLATTLWANGPRPCMTPTASPGTAAASEKKQAPRVTEHGKKQIEASSHYRPLESSGSP